MTEFAMPGFIAWRWRIPLFVVLMIGAAIGLAELVATATIPLFAGISSEGLTSAVAATALAVALPLVLAVAWLIHRSEEQRRDLAAREELLTTAQRIGGLGYWHYDPATGQVILSEHVHDLLGDPGRTLGTRLQDLLDRANPEDRDRLHASLTRLVEDGTSDKREYRVTGLDGVEKTFWIEGQRMLDADGTPIRVYGACRDVTERRRIEAALRESKDHYRHAVELNPQIPWTADAEGNILEIGPRWFILIGMERQDALGTGWAGAIHPDDAQLTHRTWSEALISGAAVDAEYRLRLKDGSYRWFRARAAARRNEAGEILRWYGTIEDIHDGKTAHDALQESEAFASSILNSSPDCIEVVDLDGTLQFMNEPGLAAMEIEEFAPFKGRNWASIWPETRAGLIKAMDAARGGRTGRFFSFCPTAKGTPKWWDISVSLVLGPDGEPKRLLAISRDMSAEKRAKDEVERARREAEDTARQLRNVLSSTTDCVVTLDHDLRFTFLNKQAQKILARGRDVVGMSYIDAFPEIGGSAFARYYEKALSRQIPVHFEGYFSANELWLDGCVYPTPDGLSVFVRDVTDRRRAQEQLLYLAHHDPLTGLANRTILQEQLDRALETPSPARQATLLFLDLDEFKTVNDTLGHTAGDRVLIDVAERIRACVRSCDTVARFGGDEFAVVAAVKDQQEASALADRIISEFEHPFVLDGRDIMLGASMGIVMISAPGTRSDDVLRDADIALYMAKAEGRGICRVFDPEMGDTLKERQDLKQELKDAVQRGEMVLEYQPLVDLGTSGITGFEALVRWKHPTRGLVSPATFIPIAEEAGTIVEIGEWVLAQACQEAACWPGERLLAVNISPVQFRCGNLVETVKNCLSKTGLPARQLQLEITESVLLVDSEANLEVLHALRELGVSISMDDFGTGYSSLSYLRSFPFDKIKIDRAFVSDLSGDSAETREPRAIVQAIIELARGFGIRTTGEGVETEYQAKILRDSGCDEGQGYLYSKPVSVQDIPAILARFDGTEKTGRDFLYVVREVRRCATGDPA